MFRHALTIRELQKGMPLHVASYQRGHSSPEVTAIYAGNEVAHLAEQFRYREAGALDSGPPAVREVHHRGTEAKPVRRKAGPHKSAPAASKPPPTGSLFDEE
jgi:hypothetical protein